MNKELHGSDFLKAAIDKLMKVYDGKVDSFEAIGYLFERYSVEKAWEEKCA